MSSEYKKGEDIGWARNWGGLHTLLFCADDYDPFSGQWVGRLFFTSFANILEETNIDAKTVVEALKENYVYVGLLK